MGMQESRTVYEGSGSKEVVGSGVPRHIAFVIDGNRRWGKKEMGDPVTEKEKIAAAQKGHRAGAIQIGKVIEAAMEVPGVEVLTFWLASPSNIEKRSAEELVNLFTIIDKELLDGIIPSLIEQNVKIDVIGRKEIAREDKNQEVMDCYSGISNKFAERIDASKKKTGLRVVFALNYGGDEEQEDAHRAAEEAGLSAGDWRGIQRFTYSAQKNIPKPDVVVRTGGDKRPSDFMPLQTSKSEWLYLDLPWPKFGKANFHAVLADYSGRNITRGA